MGAASCFPSSPGKIRRTETSFESKSIASSQNRTRVRLSRVGGSPEPARRSVAVAFTSVSSSMKEPSAFNV